MKNFPLLLNFVATLPCKTNTSVNVNLYNNADLLRGRGGSEDQNLTSRETCNEHVFAAIADRSVIYAARHTKMARATPQNTKAVREETKLKYKLKPQLKLHHPTQLY